MPRPLSQSRSRVRPSAKAWSHSAESWKSPDGVRNISVVSSRMSWTNARASASIRRRLQRRLFLLLPKIPMPAALPLSFLDGTLALGLRQLGDAPAESGHLGVGEVVRLEPDLLELRPHRDARLGVLEGPAEGGEGGLGDRVTAGGAALLGGRDHAVLREVHQGARLLERELERERGLGCLGDVSVSGVS